MLNRIIPGFVIFLCFCKCSSKNENYTSADPLFKFEPGWKISENFHKGSNSNTFVGTWTSEGFIYSINYTIKPDGRFSYYTHTCTGKSKTEGSWTYCGPSMIVLQSDEVYRQPIPLIVTIVKLKSSLSDLTANTDPPTTNSNYKGSAINHPGDVTFYPLEFDYTISYSQPDTSGLYFAGQLLKIEDGRLFEIDGDSRAFIYTNNK